MARPVAFVTGASRGIGKAGALALAEAGFDLVLTARTQREGERFEHSSTLERSDTRPVPGSLETTAALAAAAGAAVLAQPMDLLQPATLAAALDAALARFGQVDVLVNNAVYTGPGNLDRFLDVPDAVLQRVFQANVFAQLELVRRILPGMLARRRGVVVNVTSHVAEADPPAPAGQGGWGYAYAGSKAAFHRLAGVLARELAGSGVRVHNLDPGFVVTEMMELHHREQGFGALRGAPPRVPAAVIAWLAGAPEAAAFDGQTLHAQRFCKERRLLPDWPPPPAGG
jgi:NAD(P)-dependent dehydrogenase (short-subunit alcohol dehydrogenase family)